MGFISILQFRRMIEFLENLTQVTKRLVFVDFHPSPNPARPTLPSQKPFDAALRHWGCSPDFVREVGRRKSSCGT